jgi:hypothetical protein
MTREQRDNNHQYTNCEHCGISTLEESLNNVPAYGGLRANLCPECVQSQTEECGMPDCCQIQYGGLSQARTGDHLIRFICDGCEEDDAGGCEACDETIILDCDTFHEEEGVYYCNPCMPRVQSPEIHSWNGNPTRVMNHLELENVEHGKYHRREYPYFGIELEVNTPREYYRDVASRMTCLADETKTYLMEDGSISDGFEVVSQPMTFEYHKKFGWRKILEKLHDEGCRSYDSGECGIHVHVTLRAYTPLTWWKVIEFLYKCKAFVKMFAQRNGNYRWCQYIPADEYDGYTDRARSYPSLSTTERYKAINFGSRQPTAEFRLFRGTTKHERFWASVEFTYAVVEFCNVHGYASIVRYDAEQVWNEFILFVAENTSHHTLLKHLTRRRLTNNALLNR